MNLRSFLITFISARSFSCFVSFYPILLIMILANLPALVFFGFGRNPSFWALRISQSTYDNLLLPPVSDVIIISKNIFICSFVFFSELLELSIFSLNLPELAKIGEFVLVYFLISGNFSEFGCESYGCI